MDETSILALSGIIACQIKDGQFEVAKEQLDFLKEIQTNGPGGIGTNSQNASNRSEILYMSAILGRMTNQMPDQVLTLLNEAVDAHFK